MLHFLWRLVKFIFLGPVALVLIVLSGMVSMVTSFGTVLLSALSSLFLLGAFACLFLPPVDWKEVGIDILIAYLISPYGLPALLMLASFGIAGLAGACVGIIFD